MEYRTSVARAYFSEGKPPSLECREVFHLKIWFAYSKKGTDNAFWKLHGPEENTVSAISWERLLGFCFALFIISRS